MLSRHNDGVQLFDLILELCLQGCFGPHTSLLLLLPVTCLAHLPPSSFALHLTPTSHCASLTCPSKFSLSCFGPISRSVIPVCTPWAAAVSSRSHSNLLTAISYQRRCLLLALLFCLRLALLFLHVFLGSDPGCWLSFLVLHVRLIRVLLLTSWLTHALSLFLPSPAAIGFCLSLQARIADFLLLCRFLVSARACLSRPFVSSRLTATFCSSSSLSCHFRVRLLVWSAPPAPFCGSLQRRGCRSSLQHCCVVLCFGVVAGPAPVR